MQQRDYLERMIRDVVAAFARITGLIDQGKLEDAERALEEAWSAMVLRRADVARLDDTTLRAMLGEKRTFVAKLLDAEAAIVEARGSAAAADALRARATALRS